MNIDKDFSNDQTLLDKKPFVYAATLNQHYSFKSEFVVWVTVDMENVSPPFILMNTEQLSGRRREEMKTPYSEDLFAIFNTFSLMITQILE